MLFYFGSVLSLCPILTLGSHHDVSLVAYDCSGPPDFLTAIDLINTAECPTTQTEYKAPEDMNVMILQAADSYELTVSHCKVTVSTQIFHCGYDSLVYGPAWHRWMETAEITPADCRDSFTRESLTVAGITIPVKLNRIQSKVMAVNGKIGTDGSCEGESFTFKGIRYEKTVRQDNYQILIEERTIRVMTSAPYLTTPEGTRFAVKDSVGIDAIEGTYIWDPNKSSCEDRLQKVYMGPATLTRPRSSDKSPDILIVKNTQEDRYAGFYSTGVLSICGVSVKRTQSEGLFFIENINLKDPPRIGNSNPPESSHIGDMISAIGYASLKEKLTLDSAVVAIKNEFCKVYTDLLVNRIHMLKYHPSGSLLTDYGYNHSHVMISGNVAYVSSCERKQALMRPINKCTQEIPVYVDGHEYYADAFTRVLQMNGTETVCSTVAPIRWKIGSHWWCSIPNITGCSLPMKLVPKTDDISIPDGNVMGLGKGLFSSHDWEKFASRVYFESTRDSIPNDMTMVMTNQRKSIRSYSQLLNDQDLGELSDLMRIEFFPFLAWMGSACGYLTGFTFLVGMIIIIIQSCIRAFWIMKKHGCTWRLVGLFGDTLFTSVLFPGKVIFSFINSVTQKTMDALEPVGLDDEDDDEIGIPAVRVDRRLLRDRT